MKWRYSLSGSLQAENLRGEVLWPTLDGCAASERTTLTQAITRRAVDKKKRRPLAGPPCLSAAYLELLDRFLISLEFRVAV